MLADQSGMLIDENSLGLMAVSSPGSSDKLWYVLGRAGQLILSPFYFTLSLWMFA